jgi:antibiotic biosynthesis monooxygenase (ABM) superfamily enzyme
VGYENGNDVTEPSMPPDAQTPTMITRLWRGWTTVDNADAYERFLLGELLPSMRGIPGFRGADILRRLEHDEVAFITLTRFDSVAAIQAFAGDDYEAPVLEPQALALLARYERRALHFDTATFTA